jgi:hypothetical protein
LPLELKPEFEKRGGDVFAKRVIVEAIQLTASKTP